LGALTPTVDVPKPESYLRYFDQTKKATKYLKLTSRRGPLTYPMRLPQVAAGTKGNVTVLSEINPSDRDELYVAYLGVSKGFLYYLWIPFDIKWGKWAQKIENIDEDLTAAIDWETSPLDAPSFPLVITRDRYPGIQPKNISGQTATPEIVIKAFQFKFIPQEKLPEREVFKLRTVELPSMPLEFGGEF